MVRDPSERLSLQRSTSAAVRPAPDVELYSATALYSAPQRSTALQLYSALHSIYILTPSLTQTRQTLSQPPHTIPSEQLAGRKAREPTYRSGAGTGPVGAGP